MANRVRKSYYLLWEDSYLADCMKMLSLVGFLGLGITKKVKIVHYFANFSVSYCSYTKVSIIFNSEHCNSLIYLANL